MIQNPFNKNETLAQKVNNNVHLPKLPILTQQKTTKQKIAKTMIVALIYSAFFIAGFVLSKIHTLLIVAG